MVTRDQVWSEGNCGVTATLHDSGQNRRQGLVGGKLWGDCNVSGSVYSILNGLVGGELWGDRNCPHSAAAGPRRYEHRTSWRYLPQIPLKP